MQEDQIQLQNPRRPFSTKVKGHALGFHDAGRLLDKLEHAGLSEFQILLNHDGMFDY